jgi:hypothetical protein
MEFPRARPPQPTSLAMSVDSRKHVLPPPPPSPPADERGLMLRSFEIGGGCEGSFYHASEEEKLARASRTAAVNRHLASTHESPRRRIRKRDVPSSGPPSLPLHFEGPSVLEESGGSALAPVTSQQENLTRGWLHRLGFDVAPSDAEGGHFLDDPLRNGVFLCQLFQALEPEAAAHAQVDRLVYRRPTSIRQVQENVARGLWLFKIRRSPPIPSAYLRDPDGIVMGDPALTWGLLWHLRLAYAQEPVDMCADQKRVLEQLGYSLAQKRQLERSLLLWLEELGMLDDDLYGARLEDLHPFEDSLRDGTLLSRLVERVTGKKIRGFMRDPRTKEVAMQNLKKAVEALLRWKPMGRRFLQPGAAEALYKGDWGVALGLLEDMHRAADGVPPRPLLRNGNRPELPYLGGKTALPRPPERLAPRGALLMPPSFKEPVAEAADDAPLSEPEVDSGEYAGSEGIDQDPLARGRELDILPVFPGRILDRAREGQEEVKDGRQDFRDMGGDDELDSVSGQRHGNDLFPFGDQWGEPVMTERHEDLLPSFWGPPSGDDQESGFKSDNPPPVGDEARGFQSEEGVDGDDASHEAEEDAPVPGDVPPLGVPDAVTPPLDADPPPGSPETHASRAIGSPALEPKGPADEDETCVHDDNGGAHEKEEQLARDVNDLVMWLRDVGIRLKEPEKLLTPTAPEFSDGLVLADLVERLEEIRGGFVGIDRRPKARATRLQNIRKVLSVLKGKQVRGDLLWNVAVSEHY